MSELTQIRPSELKRCLGLFSCTMLVVGNMIGVGIFTTPGRIATLLPSSGYRLRHSPVGFRSQFHCTVTPQWVFILGGQMEIGLQGGVSRVFKPGEHFYSADLLPPGASFDPAMHGHWSRQLGPDPLVTLFVQG